MRLSSKARTLIMRAYTSNRAVATVDEDAEREMIDSGLMNYSDRPMMVLSREGQSYCRKRAEGRDG